MDFEHDTRVTAVGPHTYRAELSKDWEIWGPNGGYLCAIALRAAGREAEVARPVALYCHYLRVAKFASIDVRVELLGRTRRSESFRVSLRQDDKPILEAMIRTAAAGEGLEHIAIEAPAVPPPEQLPDMRSLSTTEHIQRHTFWKNFEVRVIDADRYRLPRRAAPPRWTEWLRVRSATDFADPFLDAGRSALLLDTCGWPAAASPHPESGFVAPSLDFAAWFHAPSPADDFVLIDSSSVVARDACMNATCRLFDRAGTLLASSGSALLCTPLAKPA